MQFYNTPNIIPINTVLNTTINSQAMQLRGVIAYSLQIVFTGIPTGSFKLQASADVYPNKNPAIPWPVNWTDIAGSSFTVTAAGNCQWTTQFPGYNYVRAVYTDASGGTSTAVVSSCTFNAQ